MSDFEEEVKRALDGEQAPPLPPRPDESEFANPPEAPSRNVWLAVGVAIVLVMVLSIIGVSQVHC